MSKYKKVNAAADLEAAEIAIRLCTCTRLSFVGVYWRDAGGVEHRLSWSEIDRLTARPWQGNMATAE